MLKECWRLVTTFRFRFLLLGIFIRLFILWNWEKDGPLILSCFLFDRRCLCFFIMVWPRRFMSVVCFCSLGKRFRLVDLLHWFLFCLLWRFWFWSFCWVQKASFFWISSPVRLANSTKISGSKPHILVSNQVNVDFALMSQAFRIISKEAFNRNWS